MEETFFFFFLQKLYPYFCLHKVHQGSYQRIIETNEILVLIQKRYFPVAVSCGSIPPYYVKFLSLHSGTYKVSTKTDLVDRELIYLVVFEFVCHPCEGI